MQLSLPPPAFHMQSENAGGKAAVPSALTVKVLEFFDFGELIFEGFGEKGSVLFLETTSTSPSLQAYVELHGLSSKQPAWACMWHS